MRGWTSCIYLGWFFFLLSSSPKFSVERSGETFQVQVWASSILQSYFKMWIMLMLIQTQSSKMCLNINRWSMFTQLRQCWLCFNKWLHFCVCLGNPTAAWELRVVKGISLQIWPPSAIGSSRINNKWINMYIYTPPCRIFSALSRHIPMSYIGKPENGTGRSPERSLSCPTQNQSCRYPCVPDRCWYLIPPTKENPKDLFLWERNSGFLRVFLWLLR